jgi:hypothetical protein
VRGAFTAEVVAAAPGAATPLPLGCPTLLINHAPTLGAQLAAKLRAFAAARDANATIVVTLPAPGWPAHLRARVLALIAHKMLAPFPNAVVLLQSRGDLATLEEMRTQHGFRLAPERQHFFYDVDAWLAFMGAADAAVGFRLHGSMSAVAAGTPTVVISTDWRVRELAEAHRLPTTTILDAAFASDAATEKFDLHDFVHRMEQTFSGSAFDANRAAAAAGFVRLFAAAGLGVHPGVAALAEGAAAEAATRAPATARITCWHDP